MKEKKPSIFDTIKELKNNEELKNQEKLEKKINKRRDKYSKKNAEEKKTVLKVRQGLVDESEAFAEGEKKKKKYTIWDKISNFFYHNKWWMGIGSVFAAIVIFLVVDTILMVRSDVSVMMLTNNENIVFQRDEIQDYFNSQVKDYNKDGKNYTDIIEIAVSRDMEKNNSSIIGYDTVVSRLSTQFQGSHCMIILADTAADALIEPKDFYENLEEYFPDCPYVKGQKLYLKNTDFAEKIGLKPEDIPNDLYIAVRLPIQTMTDADTTKENYDHAMETVKNIVEDLK